MKSENKTLIKEKDQITQELTELRRIQEMVAKLTTGNKGNKGIK